MAIFYYISIIISLAVFSYRQPTKSSVKGYNESSGLISDKEDYKKSTFLIATSNTTLDYILFGIFCGECNHDCATMFQYNMIGNTNTLLVDNTESYFKNYGKVICNTPILDQKKLKLASSVVLQIPKQLLATNKLTESFGCPDCSDGCGIYFEFKQGNKVKKFYIDYATSNLTTEMKTFAEYLKKTVGLLKLKR